jgi:hypothetical protein
MEVRRGFVGGEGSDSYLPLLANLLSHGCERMVTTAAAEEEAEEAAEAAEAADDKP